MVCLTSAKAVILDAERAGEGKAMKEMEAEDFEEFQKLVIARASSAAASQSQSSGRGGAGRGGRGRKPKGHNFDAITRLRKWKKGFRTSYYYYLL